MTCKILQNVDPVTDFQVMWKHSLKQKSIPIGSMYGIYANIWGILMVNVTIYCIHGSYGIGNCSFARLKDQNTTCARAQTRVTRALSWLPDAFVKLVVKCRTSTKQTWQRDRRCNPNRLSDISSTNIEQGETKHHLTAQRFPPSRFTSSCQRNCKSFPPEV